MSTRRPRREPFRFLLYIVGEQGATLPLDLMAHVAARERGEPVRDYTFKRMHGVPWAENAHQDQTVLETAVTDAEALAILDTLGIHREGAGTWQPLRPSIAARAAALKAKPVPKFVRTALDSLGAVPRPGGFVCKGESRVKTRHLTALLDWIERQIEEERL